MAQVSRAHPARFAGAHCGARPQCLLVRPGETCTESNVRSRLARRQFAASAPSPPAPSLRRGGSRVSVESRPRTSTPPERRRGREQAVSAGAWRAQGGSSRGGLALLWERAAAAARGTAALQRRAERAVRAAVGGAAAAAARHGGAAAASRARPVLLWEGAEAAARGTAALQRRGERAAGAAVGRRGGSISRHGGAFAARQRVAASWAARRRRQLVRLGGAAVRLSVLGRVRLALLREGGGRGRQLARRNEGLRLRGERAWRGRAQGSAGAKLRE
jgi:hypothetical protein